LDPYEIEHGRFKLTPPCDKLIDKAKRKPVKEYLSVQDRFRHLKEDDVERIQKWVDESWKQHIKLASDAEV
jgi:pyruvate ferredoxin oxidoreductase beta subunit